MPGWNASQPGPSYTSHNKVNEVQRQVDEVKGVMQQNVEVMLANIDKTEVLENKSAELANQAKTFHRTARATKRHMCKQNAKMNIIIACICVGVLIAILVPVLSYVVPLTNKGGGGGGGGSGPSPSQSPYPPPPSPSPLLPPSP